MADRPARLVTSLDLLAWVVTAGLGLLALSQAVGATWHPLFYVLQAFTLQATVVAAALTVVAALAGRPLLAAVDLAVTVGLVVVLAPVLAWTIGRTTPSVPDDAPRLTVLHANTYYDNDRVPHAAEVLAAAVERHDVDVLVVTEYSTDLETALTALLGDRFPHRAGAASDERNGLGVLSRLPLADVQFGPYRFMPGVEVTVVPERGVTPIRVIGVHPVPGVERPDLRLWKDDLAHIQERALTPGEPATLVVGDFNASRWHPPFRALLDSGLASVHERLGHGLGSSWPVSWWRPRFVRIDHALVDDRLVPTDVADLRIPGSDHLGFVVEVAVSPAAAAT